MDDPEARQEISSIRGVGFEETVEKMATPMHKIERVTEPKENGFATEHSDVVFSLDEIIRREGYDEFVRPGMRFGVFEIIEKIGEGSQGVAYLAKLTREATPQKIGYEEGVLRDDVKFVVKLPHGIDLKTGRFDEYALVRNAGSMTDELKVFRDLDNSHSNIVPIRGYKMSPFDIPRDRDKIMQVLRERKPLKLLLAPIVVMEYIEPSSRIKKKGQYDANMILDYLHGCSSALLHMHRSGYLYRDFKPDNLIISNRGQPFILDLGSARKTEVFETLSEAIKNKDNDAKKKAMIECFKDGDLGSVLYAAPELIALYGGMDVSEPETGSFVARAPSGKSEVYALCAAVYELMTGFKPFAHLTDKRGKNTGRNIINEKVATRQIGNIYNMFACGVSPFDYSKLPENDALSRKLKHIVINGTHMDYRKRMSFADMHRLITDLYSEYRPNSLGPERLNIARTNGRKVSNGFDIANGNGEPYKPRKTETISTTNGNGHMDFEEFRRRKLTERRNKKKETDELTLK